MIKKIAIALAAVAIALPAAAQKFGVVDANSIFTAMPETTAANNQLNEASKKYEDEFKKLQDEFNKQFGEYQQLAADTPAAIKERREKELQELDQKMQQFRQTAQQDLQKQQQTLLAPIETKIHEAIKAVGQEGGYTFIFQHELPVYVGADVKDITADVKAKLGVK